MVYRRVGSTWQSEEDRRVGTAVQAVLDGEPLLAEAILSSLGDRALPAVFSVLVVLADKHLDDLHGQLLRGD
jgi:hypothetical protein